MIFGQDSVTFFLSWGIILVLAVYGIPYLVASSKASDSKSEHQSTWNERHPEDPFDPSFKFSSKQERKMHIAEMEYVLFGEVLSYPEIQEEMRLQAEDPTTPRPIAESEFPELSAYPDYHAYIQAYGVALDQWKVDHGHS